MAVVSTTVNIICPSISEIFESSNPWNDFFYEDQHGQVVSDVDKIKSLVNKFDFLLINCSAEHWGSQRDFPLSVRIHDLLKEHNAKDFVCLCHDPHDQSLRPNILYFPFFAWRRVRTSSRGHIAAWRSPDLDLIANPYRRFLFSNLNHHARDFRIANYVKMRQKSYADRCLITLHNAVQENHGYDGQFPLSQEESLAWQQIRSDLPCGISDGFGDLFDSTHPAFSDTYLHVVSETTIKDKIFLTEKTWQTVFAGQLFMIWGNSGIISHLRDLGVDVFDDIINHGYDTVTDHRRRFECLHDELDRLAMLDWTQIYLATAARRQSNADKFDKAVFVAPYIDILKRKLPIGVL